MMRSDSFSKPNRLANSQLSGMGPEEVFDEEAAIEQFHADYSAMRLFNLTAFLLAAVALYDGIDAWRSWFSSPDRRLFSFCAIFGLLIAVVRSKWTGETPKWKSLLAGIICISASLLIVAGFTRSHPRCSGVPCSMILAGWFIVRIRGESLVHCLFLGFILAVPYLIESIEASGGFVWLESCAVSVTSALADMAGMPHARVSGGLQFNTGTLYRIASIETWGSVISLLGVALFCILAFGRYLVSSALSLSLSLVVWVVVRSSAITYLAFQNSVNSNSFHMELVCGTVGAGLVISMDQFLAALLKPIPFETFDSKYPFPSFLWNWICGLPNLAVRIPRDNSITARWRHKLFAESRKSSFITDCQWLAIVLKEMFQHPLNAIGGVIETTRGWKYSRHWRILIANSFSLLMVGTICIAAATYDNRRMDGQANSSSNKSQIVCSTETLELACKLMQESDFRKAIGFTANTIPEPAPTISDDAKQEVEFLSRHVLATNPTNQLAKYRIGMIHAINGKMEEAFREMQELAMDKFNNFPQANAWLAKAMLGQKVCGKAVDSKELIVHVELAKKWEKCDFRLPFYYSRLLEEQGDLSKAVFILKQAVTANPEYRLELARLYQRIGNVEGQIKVANEADAYFFARLDLDTEKESDRLAVSDARVLTNRPEEAAEILEEGLRRNPNAERTRRQLCKIQLFLYSLSICDKVSGKPIGNLALLEKAARTDASNPEVFSEIGKLLTFGISPTEELNEFLKNQIQLGAASAKSLLFLGDECYTKGDIPGAIKHWESALAKEPDDCTVLNNLASCLVVVSPANIDRARDLIEKANSLMPSSPDILDTWGEILLAAKRPYEAINKFEKAINLDKTREESRRKLINAYEACGMKEMAEAQSKAILQIKKIRE